jgi:hypothetical protein
LEETTVVLTDAGYTSVNTSAFVARYKAFPISYQVDWAVGAKSAVEAQTMADTIRAVKKTKPLSNPPGSWPLLPV